MIQPDAPGRKRLFRLLDNIIGEEQSFKTTTRNGITHNDHEIGDVQAAVESEGMADELERIRLTHEAMFEVHRKFINEHELIIQRCLTISRQVRAGLLNETEMEMEAERLQSELSRIREEHSIVQKECQKTLLAQSESFKNLNR